MDTLLNPGDMIRIRQDIQQKNDYYMVLDSSKKNTWLEGDMAPAGELITIVNVIDGQYTVTYNGSDEDYEDFWYYTDQMFDPELLCLLLEERYNL